MIVNISEAKTNLSKLVNMAYHGKKVVIAKTDKYFLKLIFFENKAATNKTPGNNLKQKPMPARTAERFTRLASKK